MIIFVNKTRLKLLVALVFLGQIMACHTHTLEEASQGDSSLSQLTQNELQCRQWDSSRIETTRGKVSTYSQKIMGSRFEKQFLSGMAGIPDRYLDWMAERAQSNNFDIKTARFSTGSSVTKWGGRRDSITIDPSDWGFDLSLQHEVGHYVMLYASEVGAHQRGLTENQFYDELDRVSTNNRSNPDLHSYPKSYDANDETYDMEFWAEAFNSYYCSEQTNQLVREKFPDVYVMLQKYLEPPMWENGNSNPSQLDNIHLLVHKNKLTPNTFSAVFAAPKNIEQMEVCYHTSTNDCSTRSEGDVRLSTIWQQTQVANFFRLPDNVQNSLAQPIQVTIRGYGTQQLLKTRVVSISHKS